MKRVLSLLTILALLLSCLGSALAEAAEAAEDVVVKNYKELVAAVNEQGATRILISAKYKHGTTEAANVKPEGRTVLILPENGESAVINGRVDIYGEGTVNFENVSIEGPAGDIGLWVGYGADVTIGSVTGGKAKKENGCTAVVVNDGSVTVDSAVGTDGKSGFGGDGVYAVGSSTVQVREAVGGSAPKGFGGSGVVAFGGAKVTVTGSATGGNSLYTPGKGALTGLNSAVDGDGTLTDGTELEGKKTLDLEAVTNRNMLENALRSGKTEILLAPGYRANSQFQEEIRLFCPGADPIRIASANENKPVTMDGRLFLSAGTWVFENIKFTINSNNKTNQDVCLWVSGDANVTASGSVTAKGNAFAIVAQDNARIEFTGDCVSSANGAYAENSGAIILNGNLTVKSKGYFAVGTRDNGSVTVNGNVDVTGDSNALDSNGGTITMTGTVHVKGSDSYPAVFAAAGEINLTGPIINDGKSCCISCRGGNITVTGDVTSKTTAHYPVYMEKEAGDVTINGTLYAICPAYNVQHGNLTVNGDVIIRTKKYWTTYSTSTYPGTSTVTGEFKVEN